MISTLATTSPRATTIVQPGSAVISRQASPRSTSRRKSQRNAAVAAVPIPMRTRFRRQLRMWQVSMRAGVGRRTVQRRRFSGRREVAIGLGVYALYLLASRRKRGEEGRLQAARNAERVVALERRLGLHVEPQLQELVLPLPALPRRAQRRLRRLERRAHGRLAHAAVRPAASGVPPLPPRRRADHAGLPAGLLLLPLRAAALPRPPRRHDRRRERLRPRLGPGRAALRPARGDAEHPRRLRGRHGGRGRGRGREPGAPRARARLPAARGGGRLRHREPLRPRRRRRRRDRGRGAAALQVSVPGAGPPRREADERPRERRLEQADDR